MKLCQENYKGVKIDFTKKIEKNKQYIAAKWSVKGKKYNLNGNTKADIMPRVKKVIDKILYK